MDQLFVMSCFLPRPAESLIGVIAVGRKYGAVTKVKKVTGKCYCPETPVRFESHFLSSLCICDNNQFHYSFVFMEQPLRYYTLLQYR